MVRPFPPTIDARLGEPIEAATAQPLATSYGVEVLRRDRWQPLRSFLGAERQYPTLEVATAAAVAFWQRTGHASRPFAQSKRD